MEEICTLILDCCSNFFLATVGFSQYVSNSSLLHSYSCSKLHAMAVLFIDREKVLLWSCIILPKSRVLGLDFTVTAEDNTKYLSVNLSIVQNVQLSDYFVIGYHLLT